VPSESGVEQLYSSFRLAGIPLRPLHSRQCLIITDTDLLEVVKGTLWIDNVYIRSRDTTATDPLNMERVMISVHGASDVYMTHTVLQGDGSGAMTGMHVYGGGRVHIQGDLLPQNLRSMWPSHQFA
jgi:hypothetical protein